jgi:DNA-binding transcriptional regulator YhcF (GntR family)
MGLTQVNGTESPTGRYLTKPTKDAQWVWLERETIEKHARHVGPNAMTVYLVLRSHDFTNGEGPVFPSVDKIMEWTGLARSTVVKAIRKLEAAGLIEVTRSKAKPSRYRFRSMVHGVNCNGSRNEPSYGSRGEPQWFTARTMNGSRRELEITEEKQQNLKNTHSGVCAFNSIPTSTEDPPGFTRLVAVYPDIGVYGEALQAYRELDPDDALVQTMVDAIEAKKRTDKWKRRIGIPRLARFIRERGWMEYVAKQEADRAAKQAEQERRKQEAETRKQEEEVAAAYRRERQAQHEQGLLEAQRKQDEFLRKRRKELEEERKNEAYLDAPVSIADSFRQFEILEVAV